jgi:hypothetical protein
MTPYEKGFNDCKQQVKEAMAAVIQEAILMEREACANLCEEWYLSGDVAKAIRARWQK